MKKALVILLVVALMAICIPAAFADGDPDDTQILMGNTESTLNLVAAADVTAWDLQVPDTTGAENVKTWSTVYGGSGEPAPDGDVTTCVQANVTYDIQVKSETDANKTTGRMWQWDAEAPDAYVASGLFLQYPLRITETATATLMVIPDDGSNLDIPGCSDLTPDGNNWTKSDLTIDQRTDYGDDRLTTLNSDGDNADVYRTVLTYTALDSTSL